uniref:SWIM-type domain-containing protein n=1 Tax=Lactuca sativa TaxID=4236 RepID=A0A9R1VA69_LACSA|nr:hypothetical protein LSAT_V11C500242070 [Lactuca sativa]
MDQRMMWIRINGFLNTFLKAHSNKQPLPVLSDQDAALKQALDSIFLLCMWHIIKKLPKKLSVEFLKSTDFKKWFNKLFWNIYIKRPIFERNWELLMKEFNLKDERWLKDVFENKEAWVPAYFNNFPRCGLMNTTSRFESINSFFNRLSRMIEQHATKEYTSKVFLKIKTRFVKEENFEVIHKNQKHKVKATYKVELKYDEKEVSCTYGHFNRFGMLCRHAFRVLIDKNFNEIPKQYILMQWIKDTILTKRMNNIFFNVETALDILRDDKKKLACSVEKTQIFMNEVKSNSSSENLITNSDVLEKLYNVTIPKEVEIFVLEVEHNKGSRKKRFIGEVEKSVMKAQTKSRKCLVYGKREPHSSRTCPSRFNAKN